jgi:TolB-like protein
LVRAHILGRPRWRAALLGGLAVVALGAGAAAWRRMAAPAPPPLSIAVLPFRNLSQDRSQDYLADAVSDDLTTDLSHIPGSTVIARESSDVYRGQAVNAAQIGRALHVRYLLEGSLRAEDGTYHINAQLIDAASGAHLWAQRFDAPPTHIADVRTSIVRRIASALDAEFTDIEGAAGTGARPNDEDALALFYRARSTIGHDDTLGGLRRAQTQLEKAVQLQPDFADAQAQLAITLLRKAMGTDDPDDAADMAEARAAVLRALHLAPRNAAALAADARLRVADGQCAPAMLSATAALDEEPNSIDALGVLAKCAMHAGQLDDAARYEQSILRLNPESVRTHTEEEVLAQVRLLQGRYRDAEALCFQALDGDPPPRPDADAMGRADYTRLMQMAAFALDGDTTRAQELYAAYNTIWPRRSVWRIGAYASTGVANLPGYRRFLDGLHAAGMPEYDDETADYGIAPPPAPHHGGDFDPTPMQAPGATRVTTHEVAAMLKAGVLVLDIGRGVAVPQGAAWYDHSLSDDDDVTFADRMLAARPAGPQTPVVVMGPGSTGFDSYNLVGHLVSHGFTKVYWYRGGEEAWARAGLPARDMRVR